MTSTKTLYEKLASDTLTDDDKDKLLTLLDNIAKQKEAKAINAKIKKEIIKQDEDAMVRIRKQQMQYYLKNKERINEQVRERYNTNSELQERIKERAKVYYHKKCDGVPKMKRGRKPLHIDQDEDSK